MADLAQRRLGLRRVARLNGPIAVRGDAGNGRSNLNDSGLVGEITFIVGVFDDPRRPVVHLETLNLVFDPSEQLGGGLAAPSARLTSGDLPAVEFDAESRRIAGRFELYVDVPAARAAREQFLEPFNHAPDPGMQPASVTITGRFLTRLRPVPYGREVLELRIRIDAPGAFRSAGLFPEEITLDGEFTLTWLRAAPLRRQLLVQPIFISGSGSTPATGSYFGPGLARANELWGQCCIQLIALNPPTFLSDQNFRVVTPATVGALLAEVDETDAVEVFVVERFEPLDVTGGGMTYAGGAADAKIVTGDNQLPGNPNHLAHEFGHVLGLCHPTDGCSGDRTDGCKGSVMEGSGFFDDNPGVQCEANCFNAANPLLTTVVGASCAAGPDDDLSNRRPAGSIRTSA